MMEWIKAYLYLSGVYTLIMVVFIGLMLMDFKQISFNYNTKNSEARLIIDKVFFGVGFHISLQNPRTYRNKYLSLEIDLLFIRFWCDFYKD